MAPRIKKSCRYAFCLFEGTENKRRANTSSALLDYLSTLRQLLAHAGVTLGKHVKLIFSVFYQVLLLGSIHINWATEE